MGNKAKIKEIFSSIQGEGLYIGSKQLFIRFCACNLRCKYCDTPFLPVHIDDKDTYFDFTPDELYEYIQKYDLKSINHISLTGGEPLIWTDFLSEFMPKVKAKFYLETNATITDNLYKVLPYVDIIAADIKLPSCSGVENSFEMHDKFFNAVKNFKVDCAITRQYDCDGKKVFAKIIFDSSITDSEIDRCISLANKYNLELILQPKMNGNDVSIDTKSALNIFDKFSTKYNKIRLIPQVHKFMDIE